jgi:hypothetical protein
VTNEEYKCESCNFGQNGAVCSLHGVEVERRKSVAELVKILQSAVDGLIQFKFIMLGIGILGSIILLGGYYFTADTKIHMASEDARLEKKLEQISVQVSAMATNLAVSEARHSDLISRIDRLTRTIDTSNKYNDKNNSENR